MQYHCYPWALDETLKFKPSVGQLMDLCEENYRLIHDLAPDIQHLRGKLVSAQPSHQDLHLEILEQSRYTTLIHLTYFFDNTQCPDPDVVLRVYHDSRQLEVIDLKQSSFTVLNSYSHPGLLIKWKINLFIYKWLNYCKHQNHQFSASKPDSQKLTKIPSFN